jgi:hypothetical protein
MRASEKNFTNAFIIRHITKLCLMTQRAVPSESWFSQFFALPATKNITAAGRWGARGRYNQRYRGYTPMSGAVFAGDCWQMDGSRVNMIDHKAIVVDKKTGKEVTKDMFLYAVAVRDVHSGMVLGVSYGYEESRWMYLNALESAVQTAGYLPYEITTDRFPGHDTPEMVELFDNLRGYGVEIDVVHTAEGKPHIERWFGTFQTVFLQSSDYYYGEGVMSNRKFAHRSKEYLKRIKKESKNDWGWEKACDESNRVIASYNTTPLSSYSRKHKGVESSPEKLHEESDKPNVIDVAPWQQAYLFGIRKELRVANLGLIMHEVQHQKYHYRVDNYDTLSNHATLLCCFSIDDLDTLHLYPAKCDKALRPYLGVAKRIADITQYGPNAFKDAAEDVAKLRELEAKRDEHLRLAMVPGMESLALLQGGSVPKQEYEAADRVVTMQKVMGVEVSGDDDEPEIDLDAWVKSQW